MARITTTAARKPARRMAKTVTRRAKLQTKGQAKVKPVAKVSALKKPVAKKPTTRKVAAKKTVAKKTAAKNPAARKVAAKKTVAKKPVAKKPVAKKTAAKKPVTRKVAAKKAVAKKPTARKVAAKKTVAKKTVAKKPVAKKTVAKKTAAKKPTTRKVVAKKTVAKKAATRKVAAKKTVAKKTVAKKAVVKKPTTRKVAAKKTVAKKPVTRKVAAKKPTTKKAVTRKVAAKKAVTRKVAAKKVVAKKPRPRKDSLAQLRAHVDAVEKRLKRADSLTKASIKSLKASYAALGGKARGRKSKALSAGVPADLEGHLQALSSRLTGMIDQTRRDVAHDLQVVLTDPRLETIANALTKANKRLTQAEQSQAEAINAINAHIADLARSLDERLETETEARKSADEALAKRIDAVEQEATSAIQKIGDKIVDVSEQLQNQRADIITQSGSAGLGAGVSIDAERLTSLEEEQRNFVPNFERQLDALSLRLETLESGASGSATAQILPTADAFSPVEIRETSPDEPVAPISAPVSAPVSAYAAVAEQAPSPSLAPTNQVQVSQVKPSVESYQTPVVDPDQPFQPVEYIAEPLGHAQAAQAVPVPASEDVPVPPTFETALDTESVSGVNMPEVNMPEANISETNIYEFTAPPMPEALSGAAPAVASLEPTMENARPGVEPQAGHDKNAAKTGKAAVSPNVKRIAVLGGAVAVLAAAGVMIAPSLVKKTTSQKFETIAKTVANEPAGTPVDVAANAQPAVSSTQAGTPVIQSVPVIGDYKQGQTAPKLAKGADAKMSLLDAVKSGNPVAQFQLGLTHLEAGRTAEGLRLIRLAANQGQPAAQYRLAKLYENGIGVKVNGKTAKALLEKAALGDNRIAMHDLGHYYADGVDGSAPDMKKAAYWFEKAAKRGVVDSQFNLGYLYQGGTGVERSLETAYFWYLIAATQGDKEAQNNAEAIAAELNPTVRDNVQAKVKAFAPLPVNEAANGIFANLPWAVPAKAQPVASAEIIRRVQENLGQLGYNIGKPDGAMGPKTRNAILAFERANGMPQTGRVSPELVNRLRLASGA